MRASGRRVSGPPRRRQMERPGPYQRRTRAEGLTRPECQQHSKMQHTPVSLDVTRTLIHAAAASHIHTHAHEVSHTHSLLQCRDRLKRVTASHLAVRGAGARSASYGSCSSSSGPTRRCGASGPGLGGRRAAAAARRPGAGRGRGLRLPTRNQSRAAGRRRRPDGMAPPRRGDAR